MSKPKQNKLPKHHYVPVFYLKQWTNRDGQLCEYSRKYKEVKPRRTSPGGTGYVRGLYRLPNVPEERAEIIETAYMKPVDTHAALALWRLLDFRTGPSSLNEITKVAWSRFLHCLILRNPQNLDAISAYLAANMEEEVEKHRDGYLTIRKPSDPESFDDFKEKFMANPMNRSAARVIHRITDSKVVIGQICRMSWNVVTFSNSPHLLLTSDRPVIMSNGIGQPEGHIVMPVSPTQLFVATNDDVGYRKIRAIPPKELIATTNRMVVEQAQDFVYGFSDASLSFVSSRLGKRIPSTPLDTGMFRRS